MKNRLMKILSALCVLAMLFAMLPGGLAENGGDEVQEAPVSGEELLTPEAAGEESVLIEADIPAAEEEIVVTGQEEAGSVEEETPAPAVEDGSVSDDPEEPAPAVAEDSAPAEEADPAPADAEDPAPAAEAEAVPEENPVSDSAEEPAPAEETVPAPEETPAEEAAPVQEDTPAEKAAPAEDAGAAEEIIPEENPEEEPAEPSAEAPVAEPAEGQKEQSEELTEEQPEEGEAVELEAGAELSDTVWAGEVYKIRLSAPEDGTVLLTLILAREQALDIRIDDMEAEFTDVNPDDPEQAVYTCEMQVEEWYGYIIRLSANADTEFTLKTEFTAAEPAAAEAPVEAAGAEAPAAEENTETEMPAAEEPAGEEAAEETEAAADEIQASDERMMEDGYIRVMVIRENGTGLYAERDEHAEPVSSLACGDVIWAKPAGEIWGEVFLDEESEPLYFNLNNVMLQLGEVGYDVPIRKVKLTSSLEGLTEIAEGSWVVMNAEISGFTEDEIADITWQYRASEDEEFSEIEGAKEFTYIYPVSVDNIHYEWRVVLTIKS